MISSLDSLGKGHSIEAAKFLLIIDEEVARDNARKCE